jgi:hypothetical protein
MEQPTLQMPLNNAQLELLKLFSCHLDEAELQEVKQILVDFLASRATRLADKVWEEKGWTNNDMDKLLETHLRIHYKQ